MNSSRYMLTSLLNTAADPAGARMCQFDGPAPRRVFRARDVF